ncbi:MAG: hypothetical protein LAT67_11120 [Balneolales bacterium]|nr:hypothetical protein [Balneolales bacterium]
MKRPRNSISQAFTTLFILLFSIALIQGCSDDTNVVGSDFVPSDRSVSIDTLFVADLDITQLLTFTGNLTNFSAGRYEDPVLGTITSSAFLAPGVTTLNTTDSLQIGAEMFLVLDPISFYGDTTSTAVFDIHYITERWRTTAANVDTEVVIDPVSLGSVEITAQTDSVMFRLPDEWTQDYRGIFITTENRQDFLRENEFGFALVPRNDTNLYVGFRTDGTAVDSLGNSRMNGTRLFVANPAPSTPPGNGETLNENGDENGNGEFAGRNTFSIRMRGNAFNLKLEEPAAGSAPESENTLSLLNTFQNTLTLDLNLGERDFTQQAISRAELVLYEDLSAAEALPPSHVRPSQNRLLFYTLSATERNLEVIKNPIFEPIRRPSDGSYRVNVTEFVQRFQLGTQPDTKFYIISGRNNGLVSPLLLNGPGEGERSPKLIITRVNPEN